MKSSLIRNLSWFFVALFSFYVVIFLLNPNFALSVYSVGGPHFAGASGELFRLLVQYAGVDCVGFAVFAYLAARSEHFALARAFFVTTLITSFLLLLVTVRTQREWFIKHNGDINGVYVNVATHVCIIAACAVGLLNLPKDRIAHEPYESTNSNRYVGILTFVSGLFGVLFMFFHDHVATTYRIDNKGIFNGPTGELVRIEMEFVGAMTLAMFALGVQAFVSKHASVKSAFFLVGLVISIVGTPLVLLGPHRDWIVKHTPNDRNGLYIALVINFVLFATQLLGLTAISNESKIKAE